MNNLEFNKIFASLLIAGIIAMLCGFIAKQIVHPESLEKNAVLIDVAVAADAGGAGAKPAGPEPILAMLASADIAKGQQVAKQCSACHSFDKGGKNMVGPNLWSVVGRKKDSMAGFAYSGALETTGGPTWTYAELNHFLYKPKAYASGTKMNFLGIKKPEDRAAIIAYLHSLNDSPLPWPTPAEIAAEAPTESAVPAADAAANPGEGTPAASAPGHENTAK